MTGKEVKQRIIGIVKDMDDNDDIAALASYILEGKVTCTGPDMFEIREEE